MNKFRIAMGVALLCTSALYAQQMPLKRLAVISDVHLMAPSLLQKEGKAFDNYIANDRKMLVESSELLDSVSKHLIAYQPQIIFITGDLTKDGERISHQLLVDRYLKPLKAQGIRIYVVPGNHDVNNPHAKVYNGDNAQRTTTVSAKDFTHIYNDYGYGEALATDPNSLSYVVQLDDKTRLIAVDACRYEDNNFDKDICVTAGRIKPQTMDFIQAEAQKAHKLGMNVIMMMHHGIVSHFKWQDKIMKEYLVNNWKKDAKRLAQMGIKVCFTGHFHAQDISNKYGLTDIETGSTVSYPHPYRLIDVDTDKQTLQIRTEKVESLTSMKDNKETLQQKSERFATSALSGVMETMVPKKVPDEVKKECAQVLGKAYAMHLAGDEHPSADFKSRLKAAVKRLKPYSWKWAFIMNKIGKHLSTDTGVADNNTSINY
ncbi:metallophosphoesterase family protein [Prevotella sp.]|uniref:metallophosphoesterase family protein n=1 Tax=Prevotella sp. TaxID=59823 RepID=UPI002ABD5220|nr:metallophosphoesterase [Prevotella sp.]